VDGHREMGLQRVVMRLQLAGRMVKVQLFAGASMPPVCCSKVAAYGVSQTPHTRCNLMVRHAFRLQRAPLPSSFAREGAGGTVGNAVL